MKIKKAYSSCFSSAISSASPLFLDPPGFAERTSSPAYSSSLIEYLFRVVFAYLKFSITGFGLV
jgi:hypothetical protein